MTKTLSLKSIAVTGVIALMLLIVGTSFAFADTTVVVSGNTSAGENQPGWMFNRDASTATPFEFNTGAASIGTGSLYVEPIGATAADKMIAEDFINTPIANVNSISYDFKIGAGGEEADKVHFYMSVYANYGQSDDLKFYDCRYNVVPTTGSTAGFTTVTFDPTLPYPVTTSGSSPFTCPAIPADMDTQSAGSNIRVYALNVGDTSANDVGLDGYLDNVVVNLDSNGVTTYDFDPAPDVTVTINKFVNGAQATAESADGLAFPMSATWSAENIGAGVGSYDLDADGFNGDPTPYQAITSEMTSGADYSTNETFDGPNVGASCDDGKPFALMGYTYADTYEDAADNVPSPTAPALTDITTNKHIIVWNMSCEEEEVSEILQPEVAEVTSGTTDLMAFYADENGDGNDSVQWAVRSGTCDAGVGTVLGNVDGHSDAFAWDGTNFSASFDTTLVPNGSYCFIFNPTEDGGDANQRLTREFTVDNEVVPPPSVADACETPGVAPDGYTLQNGTTGHDKVTLAPNTMFVGLGGNDKVAGGNGNFIVCLGSGNDKVELDNGEVVIDTGAGNDKVTVGDGGGTILSVGGNNIIVAGNGGYTVTLGGGNDKVATGNGEDIIDVGAGNNKVESGGGDDTITALGGNDKIDGEGGTDTCDAGAGNNKVENCEL